MAYKYFNQNNYQNVPYPSPTLPKATVKSGGCGVVCGAMIISNLTNKTVNPVEMAEYSIENGARIAGGTDVDILAQAICRDYDLEYSTSNDETELLEHLRKGGMAIANVGGSRPGYVGVFSDEGHFIVVAGLRGDKVVVLDPGYYPGKFNLKGRAGKVTVSGNECLCGIEVLKSDTSNRTTQYWLFTGQVNREEDEDMVRYEKLSDIPNQFGFREIIEKLMDAKIINGDGSDKTGNEDVIDLSHDQVRSLIFEYRGGAFDRKLITEGLEPAVKE